MRNAPLSVLVVLLLSASGASIAHAEDQIPAPTHTAVLHVREQNPRRYLCRPATLDEIGAAQQADKAACVRLSEAAGVVVAALVGEFGCVLATGSLTGGAGAVSAEASGSCHSIAALLGAVTGPAAGCAGDKLCPNDPQPYWTGIGDPRSALGAGGATSATPVATPVVTANVSNDTAGAGVRGDSSTVHATVSPIVSQVPAGNGTFIIVSTPQAPEPSLVCGPDEGDEGGSSSAEGVSPGGD
jgi:hypothetical protein